MRSIVIVFFGSLAIACGGRGLAIEPLTFAAVPAAPATMAAPDLHIGAGDVDREFDASLRRTHALTAEVVTSPRFARLLADIEWLAPGVGDDRITGAAVAALYAPAIDVCYRTRARCGATTAATGIDTCNRHVGAVVTLYPATWPRLAGRSREEQACAINTLAHEWLHGHLTAAGAWQFTDDHHGASQVPLASYVVGALAQCVYLEGEYLGDAERNQARFDVARCIEQAGTTTLRPSSCAPGWGLRFVEAEREAVLW